MVTHYVPYFTVRRSRWLKTVCGVFVKREQHATEPTCPQCAAYLTAEAEQLPDAWKPLADGGPKSHA